MAGWSRRAKVAVLEKTEQGASWPVKSIKLCKQLDDRFLTYIDGQVRWSYLRQLQKTSQIPVLKMKILMMENRVS